jgi:hypothetical protein
VPEPRPHFTLRLPADVVVRIRVTGAAAEPPPRGPDPAGWRRGDRPAD